MIFVYAFAAFLLFFLFASVGYIFQRKVIHGSCGGLGAVGAERVCSCESPCLARRVRDGLASLKGGSAADPEPAETPGGAAGEAGQEDD